MAEIALAASAAPYLQPTSLARFAWSLAIRVRWALLAVAAVLLARDPARLWPIVALAAALAAYNLALTRLAPAPPSRFAWSLVPDLAIVTTVVRVLGGLRTDAYLGYLYVIVLLAIAYGARGAALAVGVTLVTYGAAAVAATSTFGIADAARMVFRLWALGGVAALSAIIVRQHEEQVRHLRDAGARLEWAARSDPLTGLGNRRALYVRLDEELERARRRGRPLSLLLLDVDHLKRINDRSGHLAGDDALEAVADVLRRAPAAAEHAFRYGGDEFVVVLPETRRAEAEALAARVTAAVAAITVHDRALSACVGHATFPDDGVTARELIAAADRRLYALKT